MARKPPANSKPNTTPSPPSETGNGFQEIIDKQIGPLVPQNQRGEIVQRVVQVLASERFAGPIPHPRHLREYEDILPGSAERILAMAEGQLEHNRAMDRAIVRDEAADRTRGMRYGLWAFLAALLGASVMGAIGQTAVAVAFLAATVIGAVAVFVKGRL